MSDLNLDDLVRDVAEAQRIANVANGVTNTLTNHNIVNDDITRGDTDVKDLNKIYYLSENEAVNCIRTWLKEKSVGYKAKDVITVIFYIVAFLMWLLTVLFFYLNIPSNYYNSETLIISILIGFIVFVIVFVIANSVRHGLFLHRGYPYCQQEREVLRINDDTIEHSYHKLPEKSRVDIWILKLNKLKRLSEQWPENRGVYRISKDKIKDIVYYSNYHMVTIIGEGEMVSFNDYNEKIINHDIRWFFNSDSEYSFFLALSENERKEALEALSELHSVTSV